MINLLLLNYFDLEFQNMVAYEGYLTSVKESLDEEDNGHTCTKGKQNLNNAQKFTYILLLAYYARQLRNR